MSETRSVFLWTQRWLERHGLQYQAHELIESTSDIAKTNAFGDPPTMFYLAAQQTHGRGRGERTWTSPPAGEALLMTVSFEVAALPQQLTAPLVGLHLYRAAKAMWPALPWSLKAPNDLYLSDKKVAGILVETITRGEHHRLLIGLGMNIFSAPAAVPHAGALCEFTGQPPSETDWQGFLGHLARGLRHAAEDSHLSELPREVAAELTTAIKAHPHYQNLIEVTPDCDLVFPDRTLDWYAL